MHFFSLPVIAKNTQREASPHLLGSGPTALAECRNGLPLEKQPLCLVKRKFPLSAVGLLCIMFSLLLHT